MKPDDFVMWKKYKNPNSAVIFTCIGKTTTGVPVFEYVIPGTKDSMSVFVAAVHWMDRVEEYKELKRGSYWVNIYPEQEKDWGRYPTHAEANIQAGRNDRLACVEVHWTEGQGL